MRPGRDFRAGVGVQAMQLSYGHTTVKAPHPIRTAKLSTVGPDQYFGRGLQGNLGCCMSFFFFLPQLFSFFLQSRFTSLVSRTWATNVPSPAVLRAGPEGRSRYIHEAEERTKKKFLEINVGFEISKKISFLSSVLCNLSGCGFSASR